MMTLLPAYFIFADTLMLLPLRCFDMACLIRHAIFIDAAMMAFSLSFAAFALPLFDFAFASFSFFFLFAH